MDNFIDTRIAEAIGQKLTHADIEINVRYLVGILATMPNDKPDPPPTSPRDTRLQKHALIAFWYADDNPTYQLFLSKLLTPDSLTHVLFGDKGVVVQTFETYPPKNGDIDSFAVLEASEEDQRNCRSQYLVDGELLLCIGRKDALEMTIFVMRREHGYMLKVSGHADAPQYIKEALFNEMTETK